MNDYYLSLANGCTTDTLPSSNKIKHKHKGTNYFNLQKSTNDCKPKKETLKGEVQ